MTIQTLSKCFRTRWDPALTLKFQLFLYTRSTFLAGCGDFRAQIMTRVQLFGVTRGGWVVAHVPPPPPSPSSQTPFKFWPPWVCPKKLATNNTRARPDNTSNLRLARSEGQAYWTFCNSRQGKATQGNHTYHIVVLPLEVTICGRLYIAATQACPSTIVCMKSWVFRNDRWELVFYVIENQNDHYIR